MFLVIEALFENPGGFPNEPCGSGADYWNACGSSKNGFRKAFSKSLSQMDNRDIITCIMQNIIDHEGSLNLYQAYETEWVNV